MKSRIIISILALLFIAGDFVDGCDEESTEPKPDYIYVTVAATGYVQEKESIDDPSSGECSELCKNFQAVIEVYKDGALKSENIAVTNLNCQCFPSLVTIKLYKEQPIWVKIKSKNDIPGFLEYGGKATLDWERVYSVCDFGETYAYYPDVTLYLVPE
jgi:hypothetical protein